jgi:hypothetical protein
VMVSATMGSCPIYASKSVNDFAVDSDEFAGPAPVWVPIRYRAGLLVRL